MARRRRITLDSNVFFHIVHQTQKGIRYDTWLVQNNYQLCITVVTKAEFLVSAPPNQPKSLQAEALRLLERKGLQILDFLPATGKALWALAGHRLTPPQYLKHHLADCLISLIAQGHKTPLLTENVKDMPSWMGMEVVDAGGLE